MARFAQTSLFSGANNFVDYTGDPLLLRVHHLPRLAGAPCKWPDNGLEWRHATACALVHLLLLRRRQHVLQHLPRAQVPECGAHLGPGNGGRKSNWLGLTPGDLVQGFVAELRWGMAVQAAAATSVAASLDVADLEKRSVRAVPLLQQIGMLSSAPGKPRQCLPPNEYACASLQRMLSAAMESDEEADCVILALAGFKTALTQRSPAALVEAALFLP